MTKKITNEETKKFENARRELSKAINVAIGHRSVSQFANDCGMVDAALIANILNERIAVLPNRRLFRDFEKASKRRVTYSYLCQICGYSEYDCEDNTWKNFYPERGSIYMVDLGFSNLDSEQNGIRPALIISNDIGNEKSSIITVAPLTTKDKKPMPTHVRITTNDGLRQNSLICLEQVRTVTKRRLFYNRMPIKVLDLSDQKIFEVNIAIEKAFGLVDCLFNNEVAFELVDQLKTLEQTTRTKKSKVLIDIFNDKVNVLANYCRKYNRSVEGVIREYESSFASVV